MKSLNRHKAIKILTQHSSGDSQVPKDTLDLIIFHSLHFYMPAEGVESSFEKLKQSFVDWNELRVTPTRDIVKFCKAAKNATELARYIKELLTKVHRTKSETFIGSLEHLKKSEIRKYLRSLGILRSATIDLVMREKANSPIVPLDKTTARPLTRLGLAENAQTIRQKQKLLQEVLSEEKIVPFHRALLDLAYRFCRAEGEKSHCQKCPVAKVCKFRAARRQTRKKRTRKANTRKEG